MIRKSIPISQYFMISQGVVYCLTDSEAYMEAVLISALTLRNFEPELPIAIISNLARVESLALRPYGISARYIAELPVHSTFISRYLKTHLIEFSPYQETLFLDADILPCAPISDLWDYLQKSPIAMVKDRLPLVEMCDHIDLEEKSYTLAQIPLLSPQFNSGVMLWQNNRAMRDLFERWQTEWQIYQKQDQLALVRALNYCHISVAEIPRTYNVSPIDSVELIDLGQKIHLLHCWGGMVASGEFRQIARSRYPEIVDKVDFLLRPS